MDTVTQITLGAAVGEALLGKKIGNKAPLWGAVFGVVPDLDVLASPFISEMQALAIHRGITHSLFFAMVAAPIFGWLLHRYRKKKNVSPWEWSVMVFGVLITHIFVDACTSYGTQVLQPFSNYSLSFNSIFIIDPFYTLPLLIGVLAALFYRRTSAKRHWVNNMGIALSSLYLLAGFGIKGHVNSVFEQNFAEQDIHPEEYMTTPAPFSIFLWTGYAEERDTVYAGLYSVFDDNTEIKFTAVPQNEALLAPYEDQLPVERIIWFSQGYYAVTQTDEGLIAHDLRFGRSDLWLSEKSAPYVWNYRLQFNQDSTNVTGFKQQEPSFNARRAIWRKLLNRMFGQEESIKQ